MAGHKKYNIILDETGDGEIRETLWQGIKAFNEQYFGQRTDNPFSLTIRDENSKIIAGLNGLIFLDHARVEFTWVHEPYRGQGLGRQLFHQLDAYC